MYPARNEKYWNIRNYSFWPSGSQEKKCIICYVLFADMLLLGDSKNFLNLLKDSIRFWNILEPTECFPNILTFQISSQERLFYILGHSKAFSNHLKNSIAFENNLKHNRSFYKKPLTFFYIFKLSQTTWKTKIFLYFLEYFQILWKIL